MLQTVHFRRRKDAVTACGIPETAGEPEADNLAAATCVKCLKAHALTLEAQGSVIEEDSVAYRGYRRRRDALRDAVLAPRSGTLSWDGATA